MKGKMDEANKIEMLPERNCEKKGTGKTETARLALRE